MTKNVGISIGIIVLIGIVGGGYAFMNSSKDAMVGTEKEVVEEMVIGEEKTVEVTNLPDTIDAIVMPGSYEPYAPEKVSFASEAYDVVLFFRASWCPTCRAVDADIKSHLSQIPSSLAILDVDYDNSSPLKQQYGVTYQHTFVQVDAGGNLIKKWSGSPTLAAIVAEVK